MSRTVAICLAMALSGCAATGVKVSEQQAEAFKVGASTYNGGGPGCADEHHGGIQWHAHGGL